MGRRVAAGSSNMIAKPHRIECRIEDSTPVWRIYCPYPDDEQDKPCASDSNGEWTAGPRDFLPGCGADRWIAESHYSIEDMMLSGITGGIGVKVDVSWNGDAWVLLPWTGDPECRQCGGAGFLTADDGVSTLTVPCLVCSGGTPRSDAI